MIIGKCTCCGEHEITSYDGPGCVNERCPRCVLSAKARLEALLRKQKYRTELEEELLKGFKKENKMGLEPLRETEYLLHRTAGLLNFLGGNFTPEKLSEVPFGEVVDSLFRNGGKMDVGIKEK